MPKYRKKPVVIDAIEFDGTEECARLIVATMGDYASIERDFNTQCFTGCILISTPEGTMRVEKDDWILTGVNGENYICKPDIFELTYEPTGSDDV